MLPLKIHRFFVVQVVENVPPPENIMDSDLNKEEVMNLKRQHSHEYSRNAKSKTDNVSMSDVAERREYEIAAEVASLIPKFARNYLGINNLEIIAAIQVVGAQTADLRAQTAGGVGDSEGRIKTQQNRKRKKRKKLKSVIGA